MGLFGNNESQDTGVGAFSIDWSLFPYAKAEPAAVGGEQAYSKLVDKQKAEEFAEKGGYGDIALRFFHDFQSGYEYGQLNNGRVIHDPYDHYFTIDIFKDKERPLDDKEVTINGKNYELGIWRLIASPAFFGVVGMITGPIGDRLRLSEFTTKDDANPLFQFPFESIAFLLLKMSITLGVGAEKYAIHTFPPTIAERLRRYGWKYKYDSSIGIGYEEVSASTPVYDESDEVNVIRRDAGLELVKNSIGSVDRVENHIFENEFASVTICPRAYSRDEMYMSDKIASRVPWSSFRERSK